jgi:serine protease DegS
LDAPVSIPRHAVPSLVFLRSEVPASHPSAAVLGEERLGAGVAVGPERILTAHYLVMGASAVEVLGADGRRRAMVGMSVDHETGLALVHVVGPPMLPAQVGRPRGVAPGLPVFLLTCTGEQERKGACGHVSVVGPFEAFWEYMLDDAIMTTAINPGLAGAPLFGPEGSLVGVVSLALAAAGRYTLAIPADLYLKRKSLMDEGQDSRTEQRAWIGIYPHAFDGGIALAGVVPGGPAALAGMARGDVVLSVDERPVASLRELYRALWRYVPSQSIDLQVLREGAVRRFSVRAADRYEFYR